MAGASLKRAVWVAVICLATALPGPALAQAADDDVAIDQKVIGPASAFPADLSKLSPADVAEANAGIREGAESVFREHGIMSLDVSSEVVVLKGHSVLRTRVQSPSKVFYYQYTGPAKQDAVIVVCTSRTARPFNITGSECERRATQVFGVGGQ